MASFKTHITVLEDSAREYASLPVLKIPEDRHKKIWKTVTYSQFLFDVENSARYWSQKLIEKNAEPHSVVGIWLKGTSYWDLVHIWGVSRAGFVPQLFSLKLSSPQVVFELLERSDAVGLIFESASHVDLSGCPIPIFPVEAAMTCEHVSSFSLPENWKNLGADQTVFIFHTSGSTSGIPKLVPLTATWLDCSIDKMQHVLPSRPGKQQVVVACGSFLHIANAFMFIGFVNRGGCYILPTEIPYSPAELHLLVQRYGLTTLFMFSPQLERFIRNAHQDSSLLATLQELDYVCYGGAVLDEVDEKWAASQSINIVNSYGTTEIGFMMQGIGRYTKSSGGLRLLPGCRYDFVPTSNDDETLLELVVPPGVADCPHSSLRDGETGDFHTGDLFSEVEPGVYVYKGRGDDWIKMESGLKCDTRSIENNVATVCGDDLVSAAVVVGYSRPTPTLIVELKEDISSESDADVSKIKEDILERMRPFQERRYLHERISDTRFILAVPSGAIPRTVVKGNLQRKLAEKQFATILDEVYSVA